MAKFRKKPVVVEAFQMTQENSREPKTWPPWLLEARKKPWIEQGAFFVPAGDIEPSIHTLEGAHSVSWGDYIIQGVKGELYPCKPDIFELTYEPAEGQIQELRERLGRMNYEDNSDQAGDVPWEGLEEKEKEGWRAEHDSCIEVVKQKLGIE